MSPVFGELHRGVDGGESWYTRKLQDLKGTYAENLLDRRRQRLVAAGDELIENEVESPAELETSRREGECEGAVLAPQWTSSHFTVERRVKAKLARACCQKNAQRRPPGGQDVGRLLLLAAVPGRHARSRGEKV